MISFPPSPEASSTLMQHQFHDQFDNVNLYSGRRAALPLKIVIVGCGLGGLSAAFCLGKAGHKVTVLESASAIGDVGAGIQICPNLTRLLLRWGLGEKLKCFGVVPEAITFRRYDTGERVGWTRLGKSMEEQHGAPYYHIHRADFHRMLFDLASPFMTLRLNSKVVSLEPSVPSLTVESGEVITADVVIGADGIKSTVREIIVGGPDKPVPTGDAAYRAIVPTSEMLKDPDLKNLVEFPEMTGWMGPSKHIVAYCIRGKKEFNIVMCHPDNDSVESWTAEGSADKMRADFAGWEPRIQKLLTLVPSTLNWTLMDRAPLSSWVHSDGKVVLLGDACHPMLPYRAQGTAMAVEDAAILGNLFSRILHRSQIAPLLHVYQGLRYTRTKETQASARLNQKIFHLPDGPEQRARDDSMRAAMAVELGGAEIASTGLGNANQWADKAKNIIQFGYDADEVADSWWAEEGERMVGDAKHTFEDVMAVSS